MLPILFCTMGTHFVVTCTCFLFSIKGNSFRHNKFIFVDYQKRLKVIKDAKKKIRNYSRSSQHSSNESPHTQVLYYPWREMIQERTGYFSTSDEVYDNGSSRENKHKYSKIVQTPKLSSSSISLCKNSFHQTTFIIIVLTLFYTNTKFLFRL